MKLENVIRGLAIVDRRGFFETDIRAVTADSRQVHEGDLFVAVPGTSSDGFTFISDALERGALAVMTEKWTEDLDQKAPARPNVVVVPSARRALALAAANIHDNPSRDLVVAGITGTNGKTTVAHVLEAILVAAGKRVGRIGTVGTSFADQSLPATHTTPDPVALQALLEKMRAASTTHVVMEVSSHALDQERVAGVHFKVAGFTNLSQDHLDYHGTEEAYFQAKARLFTGALRESEARGRMAVVNIDDPRGPELLELWGGKSLTTSAKGNTEADIYVVDADYRIDGIRARVKTRKGEWAVASHLVGKHNLANVLTGIGMAQAMGFSRSRIASGLAALAGVPGRLEAVPTDDERRIFVDYAHTPDALRSVLATLRPLTTGRLMVVFGCGGDRDRAKRPLMGRAVAEGADLAVVTSDNPRSEDPDAIIAAIEEGFVAEGWSRDDEGGGAGHYAVRADRRAAIRHAVGWMDAGDVLVIAGKGHETVQITREGPTPFDDREEARRILAGQPPPPPPESTPRVPSTQIVDSSQVVESIDLEPDIVSEAEDDPDEDDEASS